MLAAGARIVVMVILVVCGGFWWAGSTYVGLNRPVTPDVGKGLVFAHRVHRSVVYISRPEELALQVAGYAAVLCFVILAILQLRILKKGKKLTDWNRATGC